MKSRLALVAGLVAALGLAVSACSMSPPKIWPFYKKPKPAPEAVHEVDLANADGSAASYPQYWKRNTLVIDLSGVSGAGSVAARLPPDSTWPVRVAVRVRPGSVEQVEVVGEERSVLSVTREGVDPVDLELAPSVFRANTGALYITWGAMPQFAAAPPAPDAGFQSPTEVPKVNQDGAESGAAQVISPSDASGSAPATPAQPSPPPGS
ncbi:MAG TPA: hypothetical protein VFL16_09875 [Steroidobacteraceae bacterium]|nr:hypothetical protein [Steroidobacteraceae bacterium]